VLAVISVVVKPCTTSDGEIDPTETVADTPVKPTTSAGAIEPTEEVADTPTRFNNSIAPVVISPTLAVAETPVIELGPNSNPKVPKLDVAAMPVNGSVLTPNASPKLPTLTVAD
jgi:hypothetical protein